jgi:hypothetical protein
MSKRIVSIILLSLATFAFCSAQTKPSATPAVANAKPTSAPVLGPQQRERVKDFQLTDATLQLEIITAQQKQKENQQAGQAYVSSLCKATDGETYQLHFPDLVCVKTETQKH